MQYSWETSWGSDHLSILIEIQSSKYNNILHELCVPDLCRNVNWTKYSDLISNSLINIVNFDSPIENYNNIIE